MRGWRLKCIVAVSLFCCASLCVADDWVPFPARLTLQGGTGSQTQAFADGFFPAWGDLRRFAYVDASGQYGSDNTWFASLGLGGRQRFQGRIVGAYLFIDRDTALGVGTTNSWWVFNPGFEMIGVLSDGRINFYIPSGGREQSSGDARVAVPIGLDIDAGFTLHKFYDSRWHGGVYLFDFSLHRNPSITGVETGISVPFKYLNLQLDASFDSVNGTGVIVSVQFNFGGATPVTVYDPILIRMTDLVRRHLGTLYTSSGIPVDRT